MNEKPKARNGVLLEDVTYDSEEPLLEERESYHTETFPNSPPPYDSDDRPTQWQRCTPLGSQTETSSAEGACHSVYRSPFHLPPIISLLPPPWRS